MEPRPDERRTASATLCDWPFKSFAKTSNAENRSLVYRRRCLEAPGRQAARRRRLSQLGYRRVEEPRETEMRAFKTPLRRRDLADHHLRSRRILDPANQSAVVAFRRDGARRQQNIRRERHHQDDHPTSEASHSAASNHQRIAARQRMLKLRRARPACASACDSGGSPRPSRAPVARTASRSAAASAFRDKGPRAASSS